MTHLTFHPLADVFPLLEGEAFDALVADIAASGLCEAVWLYEGQILDGRNRYRACQALSRDCATRDYLGNDPLGFVLSMNLQRRHLDESQRAMIAARLATMRQGERTDLVEISTKLSQEQAAELVHVSRETVVAAKKVLAGRRSRACPGRGGRHPQRLCGGAADGAASRGPTASPPGSATRGHGQKDHSEADPRGGQAEAGGHDRHP